MGLGRTIWCDLSGQVIQEGLRVILAALCFVGLKVAAERDCVFGTDPVSVLLHHLSSPQASQQSFVTRQTFILQKTLNAPRLACRKLLPWTETKLLRERSSPQSGSFPFPVFLFIRVLIFTHPETCKACTQTVDTNRPKLEGGDQMSHGSL